MGLATWAHATLFLVQFLLSEYLGDVFERVMRKNVYTYMYLYIDVYIHIYIYIYTYTEMEKEGEGERERERPGFKIMENEMEKKSGILGCQKLCTDRKNMVQGLLRVLWLYGFCLGVLHIPLNSVYA